MKENDNKRYTVKKIYKLEKKYNDMKERDSEHFFREEGLNVLKLYALTSLTYPLIGIGVVSGAPIWASLAPLAVNTVPFAMAIDVLFFKKRLYDLENKLEEIHGQMSSEEKNELEELIVNNVTKPVKESNEYRRTRRNNTK